MTIVTKFTLRSGDRAALEDAVEAIRGVARRKGIDLKGPHAAPTTEYAVPQYRRLDGDTTRQYPHWDYTVYTRRLEVVGHEAVVRSLLDRSFPGSVHVGVELVRRRDTGRT